MKFTSPIMSFILASAGLHLGVVLFSNPNNIILPSTSESIIVVRIKNIETAENITTQQKENKKKKPAKPLTKTKKQETTSIINKKQHSTQIETASTYKNSSESKARVTSLIHKELNQYFTYPKLAIKRNWQGKVLLSLRITSKGKIKDIQINNSSGYGVLDQAAISSLSKIGHIPEISSWLPFDIDLKFPVVYKLIEG